MALPNLDEYPLIDQAVLEDLKESASDDTDEFLNQLMTMYLGTAPKQIKKIREALESKNFKTAHEEAHSLNSTSGNLGAKRLSKLCAYIETTPNEKIEPDVALIMGTMDSLFEQVKNHFEKTAK